MVIVWIPKHEESQSSPQRVLRISLSTEDQDLETDLDDEEFERLIAEVESLTWARRACDSASACVHGVARCRPSAESPRFLCPGVYFNGSQGESGFQFHHEELVAYFPDVTAEEVLNAFGEISRCRLTNR